MQFFQMRSKRDEKKGAGKKSVDLPPTKKSRGRREASETVDHLNGNVSVKL